MNAMPNDEKDRLLTYEEAAAYLGITVTSVRSAVSQGRLANVKLPHEVRKFISVGALDAYRTKPERRATHDSQLPSEPGTAIPNASQVLATTAQSMQRDDSAAISGITFNSIASILSGSMSKLFALQGRDIAADPKGWKTSLPR